MNKKFKVYRVVNFLAIKSSEKMVKQRTVNDIECRLKDRYIKKKQDRVLETSTCISANSFSAIATPVDRMVWCKRKDTMDVNDSEKDLTSVDQNWLSDSVVKELNTEENDFVRSIITSIK